MVIGVTGKSGVGKSTLAKYIATTESMFYLDVDSVGHTVLDDEVVKKQIKEKFGIDVSSSNRKELAEKVFNNRHSMKVLSDITYAKMKDIMYNVLETYKNVVVDWILLPHTEFFDLCDKKILVIPENDDTRKIKVMERDNISPKALEERDKNSIAYNNDDFDLVIKQTYVQGDAVKQYEDYKTRNI